MRSEKTKKDYVTLNTDRRAFRIVLVLAATAAISPLAYRGIRIFLADRIVRSEQTVEAYSRALQHDPTNAELWWKRGRLRHYSVKEINIAEAQKDYKRALELNPRLSQAWVDLADVYERTGKLSEAEAALERAFEIHTYSPLIRWQAGNFFLRQGNLSKMYECFQIASRYDPEKLGIAMELAWKIDPDRKGILQKLIPDTLLCNMRYLNFLVARDELDLAGPVWQRCRKNEPAPDFEFKISSVFGYIDRLLLRDRVQEALQVWDDALRKSRTGLADTRRSSKLMSKSQSEPLELVWNGSFENLSLQGGFDWRYSETSEVRFESDARDRTDGLKSLKLTFADVNTSSIHLRQIVPVFTSGPHVLAFYLKTEGLTTDQRPYLSIQGYPDERGTSARSSAFPATTDWTKVSVPFVVKADCSAVHLMLRRDRSSKFDNRIKGSMWLDGVSIHSETPPEALRASAGKEGKSSY